MGKKVKLKIGEQEEFKEGIIRLFKSMHVESARLILLRSHQHISVHELRKNIKKIRGMLRLVRHEIGKKKYGKLNAYYRETAAVIAVLRDDTSQIELLQGMRDSVKSPQVYRSISRAIKQVEAKRKKEFTRFYDSDKQFEINQSLKEKVSVYDSLKIVGNPKEFILKGVKKTYCKARRALEATEIVGSKEVYHDLRKQVKYLMYHLMTISNSLTPELKTYITELNRLSDYLGNLHDLDLFNDHIKEGKLIILDKIKRQTMLKYIYRRRAYLKRNIHKMGDVLFDESSGSFSVKVYDAWNNALNNHENTPA